MPANPNPLGPVVVTTAGTPVQLTTNEANPDARVAAMGVFVQQVAGNTGKLYVGRRGMNKATLVGVMGVIPAPVYDAESAVVALPYLQFDAPVTSGAFDAALIYLDADVSEEAGLVTVIAQ